MFVTIKQPWQAGLRLAFHGKERDDRLHPISVVVKAQGLRVLALVSQQPFASFTWTAALACRAHVRGSPRSSDRLMSRQGVPKNAPQDTLARKTLAAQA